MTELKIGYKIKNHINYEPNKNKQRETSYPIQ